MKKEIAISYKGALIGLIILSAVLHSIYSLVGTDNNTWWAFEISIDRLVVISFLLVIANLVNCKLLNLIAYLTAGYFAVMLAYELIYIFNQSIVVCHYQILVAVYLAISLTLILYKNVSSIR